MDQPRPAQTTTFLSCGACGRLLSLDDSFPKYRSTGQGLFRCNDCSKRSSSEHKGEDLERCSMCNRFLACDDFNYKQWTQVKNGDWGECRDCEGMSKANRAEDKERNHEAELQVDEDRPCGMCNRYLPSDCFTNNQWRMAVQGRKAVCRECKATNRAEKKQRMRQQRQASGLCCCAGKRDYFPDRYELMVARCTACGGKKRSVKVVWYNAKRRSFRAVQCLVSLAAPLDPQSAARIDNIATTNGIESNKTIIHVTLCEGLRSVPWREYNDLRLILHTYPELRIKGVDFVATRRAESLSLVTLEVEPHPFVVDRIRLLTEHEDCLLPQYPFHVTLGVVPRDEARKKTKHLGPNRKEDLRMSLQQLIGSTVRLVPYQCKVLQPPELGADMNQYQRGPNLDDYRRDERTAPRRAAALPRQAW